MRRIGEKYRRRIAQKSQSMGAHVSHAPTVAGGPAIAPSEEYIDSRSIRIDLVRSILQDVPAGGGYVNQVRIEYTERADGPDVNK